MQEYLKGYPNVHFYKGLFPESAKGLEDKKFCFVHIDVDLYESTRGAWSGSTPGCCPGRSSSRTIIRCWRACGRQFTEFFADKPEKPLELPTTQCMIVKL